MPVLINRLLHRGFRVRSHEEKNTNPLLSSTSTAAAATDKNGSLSVSKQEEPSVAFSIPCPDQNEENKSVKDDDDDDDDDDDVSDDDSLLSRPERMDDIKPEYGTGSYFAQRERLLQRILRPYETSSTTNTINNNSSNNNNTKKNQQLEHDETAAVASSASAASSFGEQLRRRERAVRLLHHQYVQMQQQSPHRGEEKEESDQPEQRQQQHRSESQPQQQHLIEPLLRPEVSSLSTDDRATTTTRTNAREEPPFSSSSPHLHYQESWRDIWTFEWHSSIPAIACLLLHCLTHSALDDLVGSLFLSSETGRLLVLVGAVLALRLTGDVYWWMDDDTYDALRVDFDNRRQLRRWRRQRRRRQQQKQEQQNGDGDHDDDDAEIDWSGHIRRRPIVRALLFMVGYSICYNQAATVSMWLESHWLLYHQSSSYQSIVAQLPSTLHEERYGTCPPADVSFCSTACQDYLQQRGRVCLSFALPFGPQEKQKEVAPAAATIDGLWLTLIFCCWCCCGILLFVPPNNHQTVPRRNKPRPISFTLGND
jgi:hypothetical protein